MTRPVTGLIRDPHGVPVAAFPIDFTVSPSQYTVAAHYPQQTVTVATGEDGTFTAALEQGVSYRVGLRGAYETAGTSVRYPAGSQFDITIPPGDTPISLEAIRADPVAPSDPTIVDFAASHLGDTSNPHGVTAAQTGAYTSDAVDALLATRDNAITVLDDELDTKANAASLGAHTGDTDNPHAVTAAQVGIPADGAWYQLLSRDPATRAMRWIDPPGVVMPTLLIGFDSNLDGLDRDGAMRAVGSGPVRYEEVS